MVSRPRVNKKVIKVICMIMENISSWFDRLEREQKNKMKQEFEEFSLPRKLGGN
jgi:hypothetical protein